MFAFLLRILEVLSKASVFVFCEVLRSSAFGGGFGEK